MTENVGHTEPKAYSQVTNRRRFRLLHPIAVDLLERLGAEYDASRAEGFDLLPGMPLIEHARPPATLTPVRSTAAPIAVAFTTFPGLVVRCGRWLVECFPACGCDACRETAEEEADRLQTLLREVVVGRFREKLTIPLFGDARLTSALGALSTSPGRSGGAARVLVLPRAHARTLRRGGPPMVQWQPWPTRPPGTLVGLLRKW